jgi:replication factor C subunit 1
MGLATESMSDFAIAEHAVRTGDQQWGLLPLCAMLAVKTGYHAGGENGGFLPGYPEFAGWLGKNSSRSRKIRLLQELGHHMNYRVSADSTELRLGYVPALRSRFISLMMDKEGAKTDETIGLMDEYGLDRDDLFENLDEFSLDPKAIKFSNALDSKSKAAFTREYNKRAHKSQALVEEQGASKKRKTSPVSTDADERAEAEELDAVNDDKDLTSRDDDGDKDEMDTDDVMAMFKKKGKSSAKGKKKGKK